MDVGEIQLGLAPIIAMQSHAFVCKRLAHVIGFSFVGQAAAFRDLFDFAVRWIHQPFVLLVEPP